MVDKNIYIVQGEISTVVGAIKRNSRWNTHTPLDEEQDPLLNSFGHLKEILNNIKELSDVEPNVFLRPFLEVVRSEDTTGPITGLALTSVNKFLSYGLIGKKSAIERQSPVPSGGPPWDLISDKICTVVNDWHQIIS
ncbi:Golgi-specific brefeldin A-resistance guanine nucleotide exchange factor 1-like [Anarrhichthys ocellatus]|uniref:Golgi-specific brefeldin A-resistance guanine nucleotide exchange factor 1-like n=1 Tax=Anarrhichthys ocellatus TaxID=433405 RepID=UPI0012EDEE83|nr:Golgi-specific brefeldin A-resistance guanine nucleotide exchange factor 1-like [Anarrhichthys ocellatus]XP_031728965.1 Golgi-specific brefeldin A-resistance guanine nucleotide exchange factor 1-like [Anarrhichthys ocellatus]